jgi:KaiC/GvpD/RAD55 family RecA-like ATPase
MLKKMLSKWDLTTLATSQYAITTMEAFGFGVEHVADGIIRFRKSISGSRLRRFLIIEKMRQTNHSLYLYEVNILPMKGMIVTAPTVLRREDLSVPSKVKRGGSKGLNEGWR